MVAALLYWNSQVSPEASVSDSLESGGRNGKLQFAQMRMGSTTEQTLCEKIEKVISGKYRSPIFPHGKEAVLILTASFVCFDTTP